MKETKIYEVGWRLKKLPLWKVPSEPRKGKYFKVHHSCKRIAEGVQKDLKARVDVFDTYFKEIDSY